MKINTFRNYKHLAKELNSSAVFAAFDTETTGLKKDNDFLLEIGAVKFDKNGIIGEPFDILIKPPIPISQFITEITNIDDNLVKDCGDAFSAVKDFLNFIQNDNTFLVAHNANFDMGFINHTLEINGLPDLKNSVIDTLTLSRWAYPDFVNEEEKGQYKLQNLAKRFNINVEAAHRAYDDARVCMELFKKIIDDTMDRHKDFEIDTQLSLF